MAITQKTRYTYDKVYEYLYPCGPTVDFWANHYRGVTVVAKNPPERRVRPEPPLWKSPTPLNPQYTDKISGAKERVVTDPWKFQWCGADQLPITRILYYYPLFSQFENYSTRPTNTDWALEARLRIKAHVQNLGEDLFSLRETGSMFQQLGKASLGAWRHWRGRRRNRRCLTPCQVAGADLVTSYGIAPLMDQVYEGVQRLQRDLAMPIYRKIVFTRKVDHEFDNTGTSGLRGYWRLSQRPMLYIELDPEYDGGFTVGNPAEIAWELTPYSHVADWAIPIGDYLSALDALRGMKSVTGTLTTKLWYHHAGSTPGRECLEPATRWYSEHSRSVVSGIPLPAFPDWSPSMTWKRVRNGLSMFANLLETCHMPCNRYWTKR